MIPCMIHPEAASCDCKLKLVQFFQKKLSERKHGESLSLQTVTPYVISYNVFVETEPKADLQVASNGQPGGGP